MMTNIPETKVCSKCGEDKPLDEFNKDKRYADGRFCWCRPCMGEYRNRHYKENPDKVQERKEYFKQYHLDNKEQAHERNNAWCRRKWRSDPEYRKRKNRQKKGSHERRFKVDREYTKNYRKWARDHTRRRRAHFYKAPGSHTEQEWQDLCAKYDYRCLCCAKKKKLSRDHVIPISLGGPDSIDNIQPLCKRCNSAKGTKSTDYRPSWDRSKPAPRWIQERLL